MTFALIPDGEFGQESAGHGVCYVTNAGKRKGDLGIFRGPEIQSEGFLDVSCMAIEDAADKLGWKSPRSVKILTDKYAELLDMFSAAKAVNEILMAKLGAEEQIAALMESMAAVELRLDLQVHLDEPLPPEGVSSVEPEKPRGRRKRGSSD